MNSMPIVTCSDKRKIARNLWSNKGYNATKQMYYFGVKLHATAFHRCGSLPKIDMLYLSPAAPPDLEADRKVLEDAHRIHVLGDKAYRDEALRAHLKAIDSQLLQ